MAEIYLCKKLGWRLEFLTTSPDTYSFEELFEIVRKVSNLYDKKIWINFGVLSASDLDTLRPYIKGVFADIETVNKGIQRRIQPNNLIKKYIEMLSEARGIKKGIIINLGLGETTEDISLLHSFIETHYVDRVDFHFTLPTKGISYKILDSSYYARWIAETRLKFPKIKIVAGTWVDRVAEVGLLLKAGANSITKFPAINLFNSEQAKIIEEEAKVAGREFLGTLTDLSYLKDIKIEEDIKKELQIYLAVMKQVKYQ